MFAIGSLFRDRSDNSGIVMLDNCIDDANLLIIILIRLENG